MVGMHADTADETVVLSSFFEVCSKRTLRALEPLAIGKG